MTEVVELLAFIKKIRSENDLVKHEILNPEYQGLHYFYSAMSLLQRMDFEDIALASENCTSVMRGKTLREDEGFICWMLDELVNNNDEPSVQALVSKLYWLCLHEDGNALYEELLRFYAVLGAHE